MKKASDAREANDNLCKMFELQILQMKELMSAETNEDNNLVDLSTKLAERTAAVEILRAELNELKSHHSTVHAKGSSSKAKKKAAGRFSNQKSDGHD